MMRDIPAFLLMLLVMSCRQNPKTAAEQVVMGTTATIYSNILGEERKIAVYVPHQFTDVGFDSLQPYPVLYVLDADPHFHSLSAMVEELSSNNGNDICPEMIVVGIYNTNRTKDLTPTVDKKFREPGGGAEQFSAFLERELIPYVDAHYHTLPYRTLVGHSLGGLFVIHTLLRHSASFSNYIAIDPSLWWDDGRLAHEAPDLLDTYALHGKRLYTGMANHDYTDRDIESMEQDSTGLSLHTKEMLAFEKAARHAREKGLESTFKYYPAETHGSVPLMTEYDALHELFADSRFDRYAAVYDSTTTPAEVIEIIRNFYTGFSTDHGFRMSPPELFVNRLGYSLIDERLYSKAYVCFNYNVQQHPQSSNAYDSFGDYYHASGKDSLAVVYYKRALTLMARPDTEKKLKALQQPKAGQKMQRIIAPRDNSTSIRS